MSFVLEKEKRASERFLLVRIEPSRFILPVLNSGVYEITPAFILSKLERNGVALTKVTNPTNNDEWSQDEITKLVKVKLQDPPDDSTNVLIAFHYLYYTGTNFRSAFSTPTDSNTPIVEWQPRILKYPSVIQSFENILQGVFTVNDTAMDVINTDRDLQKYLTMDDSFYNKAVEMWLCINDVSNAKKIYSGTIKNINLTSNTVRFAITDAFGKLKQPCLLGDNLDEATLLPSLYAGANFADYNKPIPYIAGRYSRYITGAFGNFFAGVPIINKMIDATKGYCLDTQSGVSTGTGRNYICCRQPGDPELQTFGSVTQSDFFGNHTFVYCDNLSNVQVGDTFIFDNGFGNNYGLVVHVGDFTFSGTRNLIIEHPTPVAVGTTLTPTYSFAVTVYGDGNQTRCFLKQGFDYDLAFTYTTTGGHKHVIVQLRNNFEGNYSIAAFDYTRDRLVFRTSNTDPDTHSSILQKILETSGVEVDAASFTAAQTALDVNARFHIPNYNENNYGTGLSYAQQILGSVIGYLKFDDNQKASYQLIEAPNSVDVRDSNLILEKSCTATLNYQDIVVEFSAVNPHNDSEFEALQTPSPRAQKSNNKSKHLHKIDAKVELQHMLEVFDDVADKHIDLKSERFLRYRFETATEDMDTLLGDDLQLDHPIVLGSTQVQDVKVLSIEKNPQKTIIEATDLGGL